MEEDFINLLIKQKEIKLQNFINNEYFENLNNFHSNIGLKWDYRKGIFINFII
jgi:hypothetical protein